MAREDEFFRARGVIVRELRAADGRIGASIGARYEVAFDTQTATHKDGRTAEISCRTTPCCPVQRIAGSLNLQDGARVIALVHPSDPTREGRIIGARPA